MAVKVECFFFQKHLKMIKLALFLTVVFSATPVSSKFSWGPCPEHDVVTNFDLDKYLGE
jgi:hypothetical protein